MRRLFLLTLVSIFILSSCKNNQIKETKSQITETGVDTSQSKVITFDWDKPKLLKEKFISDLEKKNRPNDVLVLDFISDYGKLIDEFNKVLTTQPNFDSLNSLAYSTDGKTYPCAFEFKKKVESNGLTVGASEGTIYIDQNTDFLKSKITDLLDSVSVEYLNLYCDEFDSICCEDAMLIISNKKLIDRIYQWGELLPKVSKLKYHDYSESAFNQNLELLYNGLDNSPSFDPESGKFIQDLLDPMKEIINKYPNSKAAKEFKEFIDLLASENYIRTDKVSQYIKAKFKQ
jgi:hypothetical protein